MKGDPTRLGFSTRAIHAGQAPDPRTGAVAVPIYQTSTYVHDELGVHKGYEYARVQNPTRTALEECVAALEGGSSGHAFASGMAAISGLVTMLASGDHVVVSRDVYGGTYRYFTQILERYGLSFSWIDTTDPANIRAALRPNTKMVYVETPSNPMMDVTDIEAAAEIAHGHRAILVVDNTFMSPYWQQPIALGADVVVHSTTKYLNGHSDSIGGVLIAARPDHGEWFAFVQKSAGAVMAPFDSFLVMRGIKTLAVRMEAHERNTRALVERLVASPKVARVLYPGLPDHPGAATHARQARGGGGGMVSFELGSFEAAKRFLDRVEVLSLAESLGGVESLVCHPATMTHASVPEHRRSELGITPGLVRISVGIEDQADLVVDLDAALAAV